MVSPLSAGFENYKHRLLVGQVGAMWPTRPHPWHFWPLCGIWHVWGRGRPRHTSNTHWVQRSTPGPILHRPRSCRRDLHLALAHDHGRPAHHHHTPRPARRSPMGEWSPRAIPLLHAESLSSTTSSWPCRSWSTLNQLFLRGESRWWRGHQRFVRLHRRRHRWRFQTCVTVHPVFGVVQTVGLHPAGDL